MGIDADGTTYSQLEQLAAAGGKPNPNQPPMFYQTTNQIELEAAMNDIANDAIGCVLPVAPENVRMKGRLAPGRMLLVDTEKKRLISDEDIKRELAARRPYRDWLKENQITLDDLPREQREGFPAASFWGPPVSALYWCDGKRNLAEVIRLTELEMGPQQLDFVGYFKFLERHGYVEFVR